MTELKTAAPCPHFGPVRARIVLTLIVVLMVAAVSVTLSPLRKSQVGDTARRGCDIALYRAEIDRIRAGDGYYEAAAAELRARGYPTKSVFNWRTPVTMWLIAALPRAEMAKAVLGGLAGLAMLGAFFVMAREGSLGQAAVAVLLLSGAFMYTVLGHAYVMPVLWAGVLVGLSLVCYGLERPKLGAALGLAALFARELSGPYCAVAAFLAARERRWREVAIWGAGFAAYAAFFALHVARVRTMQAPGDFAHGGTWLQMGGVAFVIALAQVNAYLIVAPLALSAIYVVAALAGAAAWRSPWGERVGITLALYVALFAVVGYDFNQYWGIVIAPLFCFPAARFGGRLRELLRAAVAREERAGANQTLIRCKPAATR
jgi:hypothetical protein